LWHLAQAVYTSTAISTTWHTVTTSNLEEKVRNHQVVQQVYKPLDLIWAQIKVGETQYLVCACAPCDTLPEGIPVDPGFQAIKF
jgi:ABC-type uncharacterized transport system permease subunit